VHNLVIGLVAFSSLAAFADRDAPAGRVPFSLDDSGAIRVPVTVPGAPGLSFLLDTGTARSIVSQEVADALRLRALARSDVVSGSGTASFPVVSLPALSVGPLQVGDLTVTALPSGALRRVAGAVDGVLGQDVLARGPYTLDYRRRIVEWGDSGTARRSSPGARLALRASEGRYLVGLPQGHDGCEPLWLVPDSGAQSLVVFSRRGRLPVAHVPLPGRAVLTGVGGRAAAAWVRLPRLLVGTTVLRDVPAVSIARDEPDAPDGDGLLPLRLFRRVSFDVRAGLLTVEP
jgi:predicted aspartyl protease